MTAKPPHNQPMRKLDKSPTSPRSSTSLTPLDVKKKKIIQQIRTLLNDYPGVHPMAHKVLVSANYRVLYDLHLNLMGLDGFRDRKSNPNKENAIRAVTSGTVSQNELADNSNKLEDVTKILERAQRLSDKRRILRLEEQESQEKTKRDNKKRVPKKNPYLDLEMELGIS